MMFFPLIGRLRVIAALVCAVAAPVVATAADWEIAQIDGRDYVSVDSMKTFYGFTKLSQRDKLVLLENDKVEIQLQIGGEECLMNGVKFVFCHPVELLNHRAYVSRMDLAKLIDPVLRPNYIRNAGDFSTVILDPGHGGQDPGATNAIGAEAAYNLGVAQKVRALLQAEGYRVIMTRETNTYLTLEQRVELANAVKEGAIFISIHFNSGASHARGIETFTLSPPGIAHYGRGWVESDNQQRAGNLNDSANIALATSIHGSVLRKLDGYTADRGIKRARFSVLSGVRHPAILIEGGFMTHPDEARLIDNPAYRNTLATGIVEAIAKYRYAVGGRRSAGSRS